MPPVQLKNTRYGQHRQDGDIPPLAIPPLEEATVPKPKTPSLPWNDEVEDTDQPPED